MAQNPAFLLNDDTIEQLAEQFTMIKDMTFVQFMEATSTGRLQVIVDKTPRVPIKHT